MMEWFVMKVLMGLVSLCSVSAQFSGCNLQRRKGEREFEMDARFLFLHVRAFIRVPCVRAPVCVHESVRDKRARALTRMRVRKNARACIDPRARVLTRARVR